MGLDSFMVGGAKKTTKKTTKKTSESDSDKPIDNLQKAQAYVEKTKKDEDLKKEEKKEVVVQASAPIKIVEKEKKEKTTKEKKKMVESEENDELDQESDKFDSTNQGMNDEEQPKEDTDSQLTSMYSLVTVILSCSAKCGYKKQLKRPKSFTPKDKDLICPKCGEQMKIQKK